MKTDRFLSFLVKILASGNRSENLLVSDDRMQAKILSVSGRKDSDSYRHDPIGLKFSQQDPVQQSRTGLAHLKSVLEKGRGRVCPQIGPNRKSAQNLDYYISPDRSRRAEHFLSQNLVSRTLPGKVLST